MGPSVLTLELRRAGDITFGHGTPSLVTAPTLWQTEKQSFQVIVVGVTSVSLILALRSTFKAHSFCKIRNQYVKKHTGACFWAILTI